MVILLIKHVYIFVLMGYLLIKYHVIVYQDAQLPHLFIIIILLQINVSDVNIFLFLECIYPYFAEV